MTQNKADQWIAWACQGLLITFLLCLILYLAGDRHSDELRYPDYSTPIIMGAITVFISSRVLMARGKKPVLPGCFLYTFISTGIIYMLLDDHQQPYMEYKSLWKLGVMQTIAWCCIKFNEESIASIFKSNGNNETEPTSPTPSNSAANNSLNLSRDVRIAPIKLLALIAGASPLSAYSTSTVIIMEKYANKLGFSPEEVTALLADDLHDDPLNIVTSINENLKILAQHFKLNNFRNDCHKIAEQSGAPEAEIIIQQAFDNISD